MKIPMSTHKCMCLHIHIYTYIACIKGNPSMPNTYHTHKGLY